MKPAILTEMLRAAMRDNPRASEREIKDACRVQLTREMHDALFEYWFSNSYRDFVVEHIDTNSIAVRSVAITKPSASNDASALSSAHPLKRMVADIKAEMLTRLMDHCLSDGTLLRNATFGQCAVEGGWLVAVSKRGNTNEIVGKKLTEIDLRNLRMRNEHAA